MIQRQIPHIRIVRSVHEVVGNHFINIIMVCGLQSCAGKQILIKRVKLAFNNSLTDCMELMTAIQADTKTNMLARCIKTIGVRGVGS